MNTRINILTGAKIKGKPTPRSLIKDLLLVTAGTALMAAGIIMFIQPNHMAIGSVPGLAVPLHYITGLPTGILILLMNIPIFLIGVNQLGKMFGTRSVYAIISFSLFTYLFGEILHLPSLTHEYILATLYGGTLTGIGLGFVLRAGSSTGGTAILAQIISKHLNIKLGAVLMALDFIIIGFGGVYFGKIELVLWGILFTYIMSQVVDYVLAGPPTGKIAYIISDAYEQINERVVSDLNRGGILFSGYGIYTNRERKMLMAVLENREIIPLKNLVQQVDPNAFIIISNAYEIMGEVFPAK